MVLGYIGEFAGQGVIRRYKKNDPRFMYRGFKYSYKFSLDGIKWSGRWLKHSGAIRALLKAHGKDKNFGHYHVIPIPQTFRKEWHETEEDKT